LIRKENSLTDPQTIISYSAEETFSLGKKLAVLLDRGSIVALKGPLGAGKTCFAKGIISGLGVEEAVTSPTYTIVSEYRGFLKTKETVPVYHIDAYRLNCNEEFIDLGGEEIVFGNGISIIEWIERIPLFIVPGALLIDMEITKDDERIIRITTEGKK